MGPSKRAVARGKGAPGLNHGPATEGQTGSEAVGRALDPMRSFCSGSSPYSCGTTQAASWRDVA
jgi:hypothetical protein